MAAVVVPLMPALGTIQAPLVGSERLASNPSGLVFDHVTVVDVAKGTLIPEQRVIVEGRRIRMVGGVDTVSLPRGARIVNAQGKYLIPGLWDMLLHLWTAPEIVGYPLLVANGVTGIRDPGSPVPLATLGRWKREIAAGTRVGPRLVVAGPSIFRCPLLSPAIDCHYGICVTTPAEARAAVDSLAKAGADFLETYIDSKFTAEPAELFFALAAAARQAGLPFGGHSPTWVADNAADSGARFLNNGSWFGVVERNVCEAWHAQATGSVKGCASVATHLRRTDTWAVVTPPLPRLRYQLEQYQRYLPASASGASVPKSSFGHFDIAHWFATAGSIPLSARPTSTAAWETALGFVDSITNTVMFPISLQGRIQEAAGLPMVVGTDAVFAPSAFVGLPGFSLHDALAMLVVGGMSPLAALQAATINPALALHLEDSLGAIEAGKLADLVLLDADPLTEINNTTKIRAVVTDGRYYDRTALDRLLAGAKQAAHQYKP